MKIFVAKDGAIVEDGCNQVESVTAKVKQVWKHTLQPLQNELN